MELAPQTYNAQQHRDDDEHDAAFVADLQREVIVVVWVPLSGTPS